MTISANHDREKWTINYGRKNNLVVSKLYDHRILRTQELLDMEAERHGVSDDSAWVCRSSYYPDVEKHDSGCLEGTSFIHLSCDDPQIIGPDDRKQSKRELLGL